MTLPPSLRKFALAAHVIASVGWLGAVVVFLALAVAGLHSGDIEVVRAAYLMMELTGWYVLVPLALVSLVTGLVEALGTSWGLFRHYWVVAKLLINVVATVVLLLYMETLASLADVASSGVELGELRSPSPALHAHAALLLLLVAVTLAVYKPPGLTPYGQRRLLRRPRDQVSP